jgi:hypothetical protein
VAGAASAHDGWLLPRTMFGCARLYRCLPSNS